jgi:hypothetical protein
MVVHDCNPSTQKVETVGLRVQGQPSLHKETLPQKQINEKFKVNNYIQNETPHIDHLKP